MLGATNPLDSAPGTIRGDFCIDGTILLVYYAFTHILNSWS